MKKFWVLAVFVLLLVMTGCRKDEVTPPTTITPNNAISRALTAVDLTVLATNPESYENQRIQITGRYGLLPKPSCNAVLHLSPSTWVLGDAGVIIRAAGLEEIVLPLAPDNLTLQVTGRWLQWEGPIGCGDAAVTSTIWYLEADRILQPNPLSRATLTPFGWVGQPSEIVASIGLTTTITPANPGTSSGQTPAPVQNGTTTANSTRTLTPSPTISSSPTGQSSPTLTPTLTPSASPTSQDSPLATPTPTSLVSPFGASIEATSTNTPWPTYTPLPNVTVNTSTPTATPTPTPGTVNKGVLEFDKVVQVNLEGNQTHQWKFTGLTGGVITITVAPADGLDLEITLFNPEGTRVARQGDKLAGQTETIGNLELSIHGDYTLQVNELDGISGDYALILMDISSPKVIFPGNLEYGDDVDGTLAADTKHIWHFMGESGDNVTVYINPYDQADCVFQIYRPGGLDDLLFEQDSGEEGENEERTFQLDETGFYSIVVKEFYGNNTTYYLVLSGD